MTTTTMNVSLPIPLRDYVKDRVALGDYANASDYMRALIREDRLRHAKSQLEQKLLEGLASGPAVAATDAYWKELTAEALGGASRSKRAGR